MKRGRVSYLLIRGPQSSFAVEVREDVCYPRSGSGGQIPPGRTLSLYDSALRSSTDVAPDVASFPRILMLEETLENCDLVSLLELGFSQCLSLWISQSVLEEMLDTTIAI